MTPAGVPVDMMSPFSRVMTRLRIDTMEATLRCMFDVEEFCLMVPFTLVIILRFCGSGISSELVIHGPQGANVSNPLARVNCLSFAWMSLADASFSIM